MNLNQKKLKYDRRKNIEKLNNYGIDFIIGGIILVVLVFIGGRIIANTSEQVIANDGNTIIMVFTPLPLIYWHLLVVLNMDF